MGQCGNVRTIHRYIDQLLSELEAVQRRLGREEEARLGYRL
jgi:hypothetical protein